MVWLLLSALLLDVSSSVAVYLVNNVFVAIAALLVFVMTIAVGFLEIGELGEKFDVGLIKTIMITCIALFVMAIVGFNTAFAPTIHGIIGDPFYEPGLLLGGFDANAAGLLNGTWWSMTSQYFNTGLDTGSYFLFEAAFASVTFALVSVVALRKMRLKALLLFSIMYFIVIWNLPAAWIWNPTGWLYQMGMRDFAGGLVVHAAAGAAGFALVLRLWMEEKRMGFKESPKVIGNVSKGWITLGILLLWIGWFGFNPGSVLSFNSEALVVVLTTFLAAASCFISILFFRAVVVNAEPDLMYSANGIIMGLIIITPVAGFVSPLSAMILGILGGPLYLFAENKFAKSNRFTDPIGLFPGHFVGGIFGVLMIAFFTQAPFAAASGNGTLPNGLLFGGGTAALQQLGIEAFGILVVVITVFIVSFATIWMIGNAIGGIANIDYYKSIGGRKRPK
ncbi:MAG: ammonium transporter [Candidatus Micrarchaeota archaeon]|nr:ammonium transporter [Candidatus Micrarchaeota archaeon]